MYKLQQSNKLDIFDSKINSLINALIPAIMILIPLIFILYVLNIHGYIFPQNIFSFRLNYLYQYLFYLLGGVYIYKIIVRKVVITWNDIFLFIFMFMTIISTIFAFNTNIALYGYPNRYEGMYTLLFYCFLYLDCKLLDRKTNIKVLMKILVMVSIIHFIFAILQLTGLYEKIIFMYKSNTAIGLTENCNFLGSLMCLFSIISVGGYLLYSKKKDYCFYLFFLVICYSTLLLANSSGPFLSFILTFLVMVIVLIIKKLINYQKLFITIILLVILYPICLYRNDTITPELKNNFQVISKIIFKNNSLGKITEELDEPHSEIRKLGHGRIRIWNNVWNSIKKRPFIGYGPDNLGLVYKFSSDDTKIADKAHNIYLHIWVSSGLIALLSYILWLITTIFLGLKSKNNLVLILCFGVIAYSIQGIFNINVIEVTPYFYLTIGFMMFLINEKKIALNLK